MYYKHVNYTEQLEISLNATSKRIRTGPIVSVADLQVPTCNENYKALHLSI